MAKRVVILGGTGKMGQWFAKFLKNKGFNVTIHSRSSEKAAQTAKVLDVKWIESLDNVVDADMVIVSTSLSATAETIQTVAKKMRKNAILFDIASIKKGIIEALKDAQKFGVRTISIHPMFGPGISSLKEKHVIVIPVGDDKELVEEVLSLFEGAETHIIRSGEAHDMIIALTLSLPHFLNIIFGKILSKEDIMELKKFSGTTFALQLLITEAVYNEDPDLYYEIQSQNTFFTKVLDVFLKAANISSSAIKENDRETFVNSFKEVRKSLAKDPNFSKAYNRFCKAYEAERL